MSDVNTNTNTNEPVVNTTTTQTSEGKTFSEDYVKTLREESRDHRIKAKGYESKLKEVLGLTPDADLSDLDNVIKGFKQNSENTIKNAIAKANERLVSAEIKSKTDYDPKLVERLLDKSKLTIEEDGTVKGLDEALIELEKEFPSIRKITNNGGGVNPANNDGNSKSEVELLQEQLKNTTDLAQRISLRSKIASLLNK